MPGEVTVRPTRLPEDGEFLRSVYASTRAAELAMLGWSDDQLDTFIGMQFDAQSRGYAALFPAAHSSVVLVDGTPAGRLLVDRSDEAMRIVDLALLPEFQRAGAGSALVRVLLDEADTDGLPVHCSVLAGSDARLFWERLGFIAGESNGAYVAMERSCST